MTSKLIGQQKAGGASSPSAAAMVSGAQLLRSSEMQHTWGWDAHTRADLGSSARRWRCRWHTRAITQTDTSPSTSPRTARDAWARRAVRPRGSGSAASGGSSHGGGPGRRRAGMRGAAARAHRQPSARLGAARAPRVGVCRGAVSVPHAAACLRGAGARDAVPVLIPMRVSLCTRACVCVVCIRTPPVLCWARDECPPPPRSLHAYPR